MVYGLWFMVYGLWFRVQGSGVRVRGKIGMRNEGSGFAASIYEAMPEGSI